MMKYFLTIVIFLLSQNAAIAAPKEKIYEPVITKAKIRGDGMLVDEDAMIIGVKNSKDPRATEYVFYYFGVDEDGNLTEDSLYKVYQNPEVTWPDYLQETLEPKEIDDSKILAQSANSENMILVEEDRVYFNGKRVKSGEVLSGGVMTFIKGKLRYNGKKIKSGTVVSNGKVVK